MNCPKCGKPMSWILSEVAPDTPFWLCFEDWGYIEDTESGLTLGTECDFTDDQPVDEHINARCIPLAMDNWHQQVIDACWKN